MLIKRRAAGSHGHACGCHWRCAYRKHIAAGYRGDGAPYFNVVRSAGRERSSDGKIVPSAAVVVRDEHSRALVQLAVGIGGSGRSNRIRLGRCRRELVPAVLPGGKDYVITLVI